MNNALHLILVTGVLIITSSCGAPDSVPSAPAEDLFSAISTGDHRILDDLNPSHGSVEALRRRRPDGPYILGRALERRGRDAAARQVYQTEVTAGVSRWAGLSALRLAVLSNRRDNLLSAQEHAENAVDLIPEFRDGWMALGTAMYRREDYSALLELGERLPSPDALSAGEWVSLEELFGEAALWQAVSAWETGEQPERAFRNAFIGEPVQAIHERLFLYLFYRNDGSASFSPVVGLLMESVYRQERGESREALRLMTMVEPKALIETSLAIVEERSVRPWQATVAELGIWDSLLAMVRDSSDSATSSWIARLQTAVADRANSADESDGEEFRDLRATVDVIRAEVAITGRAGTDEVIDLLIVAAGHADSEAMRHTIAQRLVAFSVDRGRSLKRVVADLQRLPDASGAESFPEAYAIAADRLLPRMVRDRSWRDLAPLLQRIPDDARDARNRILFILVHAADAGLLPADEGQRTAWQDELTAAVEELSAIGYIGMVGRVRAGLPLVETAPPASEASEASDPGATEPLRALDVAHAEALVLAGDSRSALTVAMRAARAPHRAGEMVTVATRMAELGHTSDALDVARRAVSRAELPLTPEIVELIYPIPFRAELEDAADRHGVPAYLLTALVREESHFRPIARSPVGAQGLGQIMPATADDIRRRMEWPEADVGRPADNLLMSAYYLDYLAGQIEPAVLRLAAYNAGLGRGRRWQSSFGDLPPILQIEALPFVETRWYLRRITVSHAIYRQRLFGTGLESALEEFMEGAIW